MSGSIAGGAFRQRLLKGDRLLGTFLKSGGIHAIEILGIVGFDFVVIDAEHAPFDAQSIDLSLLAAQAVDVAALVRVPDHRPAHIQTALDCGAAGVIVPHVQNRLQAEAIVSACKFKGGSRGYSNSPRSARYGAMGMADYPETADQSTTVIAMIEDALGLEAATDIAAVDGIDGLFVGRADMAMALGSGAVDSDPVIGATQNIARAAQGAGRVAMTATSDLAERDLLETAGITAFVVSSDQGLLRQAAIQTQNLFRRREG